MIYYLIKSRLTLALVASLGVLVAGCSSAQSPEEKGILVAAAADLGPAFEEIGLEYEKATGTKVIFSFGSTGTLARQIENGAPMDLFAAAKYRVC